MIILSYCLAAYSLSPVIQCCSTVVCYIVDLFGSVAIDMVYRKWYGFWKTIAYVKIGTYPNTYIINLQVYGHKNVSILDGGLPKWIEKDYPTVSGPQQEVPTSAYRATYHPELYRTLENMLENHSSRKEQVTTLSSDAAC